MLVYYNVNNLIVYIKISKFEIMGLRITDYRLAVGAEVLPFVISN